MTEKQVMMNYYHVRMKIPAGSPNMKQFKAGLQRGDYRKTSEKNTSGTISSSAASSAGAEVVSSVSKKMSAIRKQSGTLNQKIVSMHRELMKLGLGDLQKMYGNKFGYALGLVNNTEPIVKYNENKRFYGASSPKTMAGLVQLIKYRGTKKAMNYNELAALLTYRKHAGRNSGSNGTNRAISMTHKRRQQAGGAKGFVPYKRRQGEQLGAVELSDVKAVAEIFGIENNKFLWGRTNNQQSPRDMFKFFSGLQRMVSGTSKKREKEFYEMYKNEVDSIVKTQMKRRHSPRVNWSGVTKRNHWGKGGRAMHAVSHTFVIDGKYVISVYVDLGNEYGQKQGGDHEGYAVLNTVLAKLLERV